MKSYELLPIIAEKNPSVTHFLLRVYIHTQNIFKDNPNDFSYEWLPAKDTQTMASIIQSHELGGKMVGLTSMIMTDRGIRSLLMLDYSLPQSIEAEREIAEKISAFNQSGDVSYSMEGFLIRSNTSYHYIGTIITTQENFTNFLGSALLFRHKDQEHFVVDDRWLGHSLKKGFGTIRIGRKDGKNFPTTIREIQ